MGNGSGTITNCFNRGIISARYPAGGIIGSGSGYETITNCYNMGNISATGSSAGGIIGSSSSTIGISYCYNSGDVSAPGYQVAGIVANIGQYASSVITYSHNTGNITGSTTGEITDSRTSDTGCTYLIKTTNALNVAGATGMTDMTNTMSISNFITLMNQYVTTNNSNPGNTQLKNWKLQKRISSIQ